MQKNAKCKTSRKHLKFLVLKTVVSKYEKCRKNTKSAHSVHFFKFQEFSGFSDFQLRIEVKFQKKGVFDVLEKFSRFTGWRSTPITWGENLNFAFFRKVRNTFSVLGPILCCFTRKIRRTKMTPRLPL
jgi:hypothetical protein